MEVDRKVFYRGFTYEEWASQQYKDNLEFRAIDVFHKTYPGYNLEEIRNTIFLNAIGTEKSPRQDNDKQNDDKQDNGTQYYGLESKIIEEVHKIYPGWSLANIKEYIPGFLSNYLKLMQSVSREHPDLNMGNIERFIFDYIEICKTNNNIYIDTFGISPVNVSHLSKWNSTIGKITKVLFEHPGGGHIDVSKYKSKDEQGHSGSYKTRIGGRQYSIRADEQLGRDISKIRSDHKHRFETESDFLRELIFKGVAIYSLINQDDLTEGREILLSMERKMSEDDELSRRQRKDDIDGELSSRLDYLEEILDYRDENDRKELLGIFRDNLHRYLNDSITDFVGSKALKIAIKRTIMESRDLEHVLRRLEENKLVSKEYIDSITRNGTVIPFLSIVQDEDVKNDELKK